MQSTDVVVVTTVTDAKDKADAIAKHVVETRAAACAQVSGPITSTYWWEGKLATDTEWKVEAKTTAGLRDVCIDIIKEVHDYEVPEILAVLVEGGWEPYLAWVRAETEPSQRA